MALTDPVDVAHIPIPTNDSERLVFRQLFETLVWLDCEGNVRPGLAVAWSADSARRVWSFSLRDSSHSSSDGPDAARIVSSWRERLDAVQALGIEAAWPQPDGRLSVRMRDPPDSAPRVFADPTLALSYPTDSVPWLADGAGLLRSRTPSRIEYRLETEADPRDALDQGTDLLITRDPALVEYAAGKPDVTTFPLPWSRTYVLLQPPGARPLEGAIGREAVRADARRAEPPFWWESSGAGCARQAISSSGAALNRVAYVRGDQTARDLAERLVALASGGEDLRTVGLDTLEFGASLAGGIDRAYIIALPRQSLAPCRDSAAWSAGATLQPLIDTRAHAVVRKGAPRLTVEWDGTLRVAPR